MKNGSVATANSVLVRPIKQGPEGYITQFDMTADGSRLVAGPDTRSGYIRDTADSAWRPLFTEANMTAAMVDERDANARNSLCDGDGIYGIKIAPSNPDIIVAAWGARLLRTTTAGVGPWVVLGLPATKMLANGNEPRLWSPKVDIHPTDPNIVVVATNTGVHYTQNANLGASSTFTQVSGLPAIPAQNNGDPSAYLVQIDPGNPNYVYIAVHNTGIYRSTTGITGTFTAIGGTNAPTTFRRMEVCNDGLLWVQPGIGQQYLYKIARGTGNTWTRYGTAQHGIQDVQGMGVSKTNSNQIYIDDGNAYSNYSADGGATWYRNDGQPAWSSVTTDSNYPYQNYTDVPIGENAKFLKGGTRMLFDSTGRMWTNHGTGVSYSSPAANKDVPWNYYDHSKGINQIINWSWLSIPGNPVALAGCLDKTTLRQRDLNRYCATKHLTNPALSQFRINHVWQQDHAPEDPNYVVAASGFQDNCSGFSTDGGKTWQPFPVQPGVGQARMICTGVGKAIWVPGYDAVAKYTLDGGNTWPNLNLPGQGTSGTGKWMQNPFFRRFMVASDKQRPGAATIITSTAHDAGAGVWRTLDHGATWTNRFTGVIDPSGDPSQYYHCKLQYIPGRSGELLYTSGFDWANNYLMRSLDDGQTWTQLRPSELRDVHHFGFGPTLAGTTHPVLFLYARLNGTLGLYYSLDFLATAPVLASSRFPTGHIDGVSGLCGEVNDVGGGVVARCYGWWFGGGAFYVDLLDVASGS